MGPRLRQRVTKGSVSAICPGALACTTDYYNPNPWFNETDQIFNNTATFTNVGATGAYDYQSVATHESGHSLGLDHANSSIYLTMYHAAFTDTTRARSLARGDVLGLRAVYPYGRLQ